MRSRRSATSSCNTRMSEFMRDCPLRINPPRVAVRAPRPTPTETTAMINPLPFTCLILASVFWQEKVSGSFRITLALFDRSRELSAKPLHLSLFRKTNGLEASFSASRSRVLSQAPSGCATVLQLALRLGRDWKGAASAVRQRRSSMCAGTGSGVRSGRRWLRKGIRVSGRVLYVRHAGGPLA